MTRDPVYSAQANEALERLALGSDVRLHNAVCDAIDLVCDHGDEAAARREQLRSASGTPVWKVAVRTDADWVVLWWPVDRDALIYYIGSL